MTATLMPTNSAASARAGTPLPQPRSARVPARLEPMSSLQQQARVLDGRARQAAAEGNIAESARLILQVLQCERRLANSGPQVLQLIKPRSRN